jgi:hypothetical protein
MSDSPADDEVRDVPMEQRLRPPVGLSLVLDAARRR